MSVTLASGFWYGVGVYVGFLAVVWALCVAAKDPPEDTWDVAFMRELTDVTL